MADQFTESQIATFKDTFTHFDKNGDGSISVEELGELMRQVGYAQSEAELQTVIKEVDADNSGKVEFPEFLMMISRKMNASTETHTEELLNAFKAFDADRNGFISAEELKQVMKDLGQDLTGAELDAMMKAADTNGDGKINYQEFCKMMK